MLAIAVITSFGSHLEVFGTSIDTGADAGWCSLRRCCSTAFVVTALFRLATAHRLPWHNAPPAAFAVALMWQAAAVRRRDLRQPGDHPRQRDERRLRAGPRAGRADLHRLGDGGPRGRAQRRARAAALAAGPADPVHRQRPAHRRRPASLRDYAKAQRHKGFQNVEVSFEVHPKDRPAEEPKTDEMHSR